MRKTWALLVLLALHGAGAAAPRERVGAMLWPGLPESSARRNLRRELARLTQAGAAGVVLAEGPYLALGPGVSLDVATFEAACNAGRCADALSIWQGPLADGLQLDDAAPFDAWLAGERERLRQLWRQALHACAESAPPDAALLHWQALLADDPLQEAHHRALMRLHLAAGRRESALAQYESCRVLLAAELGLTPLADTEALAAQARGAAVPGGAPRATADTNWAGPLPFVGREAEVQQLEAAWPDVRLFWIEGEGGVGKTRLARDFCAAHGPYAVARCRPGERAVPFAAFTRMLRALAADAPVGPSLQGLPDWALPELARLLPELGPAPRPLGAAEEESRFFEAQALAWRLLSEGNFDAIVIDDWHHADDNSQALLAFVVARLGTPSARVLLLARPLPQRPALADSAGLTLLLEPLPAEAVAELVLQMSYAAAPTRFARRLQRATGGNPFFIAETLRHLGEVGALRRDAQGRWHTPYDAATEDYHELPLPATVRDAVLARVQRLPDAARRLLEAASLAAEPFTPALLAAACALSEVEALAAIEQAMAAALLREHESGGYAFGHDLAQQALDAALKPQRRRLVHRRLALAAEATRADPGLTALHFEAGGEPARALPFRLAAGDEARDLFAHRQAIDHWQAALAHGPAPAQAAALHLRCARAFLDRGDADGARACQAHIEQLLGQGALPEAERTRYHLACADLLVALQQPALAVQRVDAVLAELPTAAAGAPQPARAQALTVRSQALHTLGRLDDAQLDARAALALLDPSEALARAELLDSQQVIEYQRGRVQDALTVCREAVAIWRRHGDRRGVARSHYRLGVLLLVSGQAAAAEAELRRAREMAAAMHLVEMERDAILNLIKVHADRGEASEMLALADAGWRLSPGFPRPRIRQILLQARYTACCLTGELGLALQLAEQFLAEAEGLNEPIGLQYAVLSALDLYSFLGDFDEARALVARVGRVNAGELAYIGDKLVMARAAMELRAGDPAAAQRALAPLAEPGRLQQPQDVATLALQQAGVQLARADVEGAEAALGLLQAWQDEIPNVEIEALIWAARLQAMRLLGRTDALQWQRAHRVLQGPGVPAMEALDLRRALRDTAPDGARARAMADEVQAAIERIAASLAGWPAQRQRFLGDAARRG